MSQMKTQRFAESTNWPKSLPTSGTVWIQTQMEDSKAHPYSFLLIPRESKHFCIVQKPFPMTQTYALCEC